MSSMDDLLRQVERDESLRTTHDKAVTLASLIPPAQLRAAVAALAIQVLNVRTGRTPLGIPRPEAGTDRKPYTRRAPGASALPVHASRKILAARRAWDEWLETKIALPGTNSRLALADMTSDQLRRVADALYDAHEQVHRLAEAVDQAGAVTARELPPEAAKHVLEAA